MQETLNRWFNPQTVEFLTSTTGMSIIGGVVLLYVLAFCRIFARAGGAAPRAAGVAQGGRSHVPARGLGAARLGAGAGGL
jgi:hypothetical protein